MSLELGEDDCKDGFDISEQEKDIADQVLDNILKMSGIERSVQVIILWQVQKIKMFIGPKYIQTWWKKNCCPHLKQGPHHFSQEKSILFEPEKEVIQINSLFLGAIDKK